MSEPAPDQPRRRSDRTQPFRWLALFEHTVEPIFVLNRSRRLVFVNAAFETLTAMPAEQLLGLSCRNHDPASPASPPDEVLAHALTPPLQVAEGSACQVRRFLPGTSTRRWWQIDFLPLSTGGTPSGHFVLGRIQPLREETTARFPVPERLANLRQRVAGRYGPHLWESSAVPSVRRLADQARLAASFAAPVFLIGETGTGKHTLARTIHGLGPAKERPFVALDCRRLPPAALVSVLFAGGGPEAPGTIYLHEPASLPRDLQLRLCDVLVRKHGPATSPRFLGGAAVTPEDEMRAGRMLDELACVLATMTITLVPLRQRMEDLPLLVEAMLARASEDGENRPRALAHDAWEPLRAYSWPGNLAELYRTLAQAGAAAQGELIAAADLPSDVRRAWRLAEVPDRPVPRPLPLDQLLEEAERRLIELALRRTKGHKTRAAQVLGIWRQRLVRRMEALHIVDTELTPDTRETPDHSTGEGHGEPR